MRRKAVNEGFRPTKRRNLRVFDEDKETSHVLDRSEWYKVIDEYFAVPRWVGYHHYFFDRDAGGYYYELANESNGYNIDKDSWESIVAEAKQYPEWETDRDFALQLGFEDVFNYEITDLLNDLRNDMVWWYWEQENGIELSYEEFDKNEEELDEPLRSKCYVKLDVDFYKNKYGLEERFNRKQRKRGSHFKEAIEWIDNTKTFLFHDYYKAKDFAKKQGLIESEYGDVYGTIQRFGEPISYGAWNKSGKSSEQDDVRVYYVFRNGKPAPLPLEYAEDSSFMGVSVEDFDDKEDFEYSDSYTSLYSDGFDDEEDEDYDESYKRSRKRRWC